MKIWTRVRRMKTTRPVVQTSKEDLSRDSGHEMKMKR